MWQVQIIFMFFTTESPCVIVMASSPPSPRAPVWLLTPLPPALLTLEASAHHLLPVHSLLLPAASWQCNNIFRYNLWIFYAQESVGETPFFSNVFFFHRDQVWNEVIRNVSPAPPYVYRREGDTLCVSICSSAEQQLPRRRSILLIAL